MAMMYLSNTSSEELERYVHLQYSNVFLQEEHNKQLFNYKISTRYPAKRVIPENCNNNFNKQITKINS